MALEGLGDAMIMDKTVDKFISGKYIECSGFHDDIPFDEVVELYRKKQEYSKIVIRQWKNQKEVKSITI